MRSVRKWSTGLLAIAALLSSGCAATGASTSPSAGPSMSPTMSMSTEEMANMVSARGPSAPARMVCDPEIQQQVARIFELDDVAAKARWRDELYTCTYRLPTASLVLSVQDATNLAAGRAYFADVQSELVGGEQIRGVLSFGLPALQTPDGTVVFLRDGKTLTVDATALPRRANPDGQSPTEVAYAVAAAVVACWTH